VARGAGGEADGCSPKRVVGRWHQNFVAGVEQRIGAHHDQLRGAVTELNVVDRDTPNVLLLTIMHHRLTRRKHPFRIDTSRGIAHVVDHVLNDFIRRLKAECCQVTGIELMIL